MTSLQPDVTLWKKGDGTELKNVCTVEVPIGKTLRLRTGDPTTSGSVTIIRYDVIVDVSQQSVHKETKTDIFQWNGQYHEVNTQVINGQAINGETEGTIGARTY
jgi:hypothetical protein